MKKSLIYTVLAFLAFWIINRMYGMLAALGLLVIIIVALIWKRRASILTQLAAQAYYVKGNAEKGEKLYQMAYKTGLMTPDCKISYSSFCLRENKFEKGRRLLNEIINSSRTTQADKLNAKHNLSVLIWKEGNLDEAISILELVHKEIPATNTYGTLGVLYLERAKRDNAYGEVLDFMLEAYDYNESDKTIADNLGELYMHMGEFEKSKEIYSILLENEMITPMPYYNYGLVLKALGDTDGAKANFEKALTCRFTSVMTVTREMVQQENDSLNL